jgi:phosphomannomutase
MSDSIEARARAWMAADVDEADRAELARLLAGLEEDPGGATRAALASRFSGPLRFGTAGLRGRVEAGESRMNRATVIRATAGLADHLLEAVPDAKRRGVVLGRDARHGSAAFQADAAAVLAARGIRVHLLEGPTPTPLTPFAVRRLGAGAGIVITASHNPPKDNGYKVYWDHGAQIAPPTDAHIAAAIDRQPPANEVPRAGPGAPEVEARQDLVEAYLRALEGLRFVPEAPVGALSIVYTAMHGVGGALFVEALRRRGFERVEVVPEQHAPDPDFPTVTFPNPEEAGALDLAKSRARAVGADLVLANDPDGDRLAAVARCPRRGWVQLSGNDVGVLLARHLIDHDQPEDTSRLVVSTVVSSRLLGRMAKDLGVRHAETLTGFKHIAATMRELEEQEGLRALIGYEEALGYAVSRDVPDKDGISAGVVLAEMAAVAKGEGRTLLDVLEAIHRAHGLFVEGARSLVLEGLDGSARIAEAMRRLRGAPSEALREAGVREVWDLESGRRRELGPKGRTYTDPSLRGDVLVFELASGGRVAARPSGTEPKLKLYLEGEAAWPAGEAHDRAAARARADLEATERRLIALAGLEDVVGGSAECR